MLSKIFDKVIFVEDKVSEIAPLIKLLDKQNVFWKVFSGKKEELPINPFDDVSFIFLDLNLGGFNPTSMEANIKSVTTNVLNRIVGENNCPYLCVAWTSQSEHANVLDKIVINKKPIAFITMNKTDYFSNNFKSFNAKKFEKDLVANIESKPAFIFLEWWKKANNYSQKKTLLSLFDIKEGDWNKEAYKIIEILANSAIGQHSKKAISKNGKIPDFVVEAAGMTLGDMLKDDLMDSYSLPIKLNRVALAKADKVVKEKVLDLLNSKLYFSPGHEQPDYPGNLIPNINKIFDFVAVIEKMFLTAGEPEEKRRERISYLRSDPSRLKVFDLVVTPLCDHVQNKNKFVQLIPVIFIEKGFAKEENVYELNPISKDFFRVKAPGYCESLPREFVYEDRVYVAMYDMSFKKTVMVKELKNKKAVLRVKSQLLIKIQKDLANHLSRIPLIEPVGYSSVGRIFQTKLS